MNAITQFAAADLLSSIGLDWKMLLFQIIGFVILVWIMSKYVYPPLIKTIDSRQADIEASTKAAASAEKKAEEAQKNIEELLKKARMDAKEIVATAKEEAVAAMEAADAKSKERAERLITEAHAQVEKDIVAAKKSLHNETIDLVALATEKVLGKVVTAKVDSAVIASVVKDAK